MMLAAERLHRILEVSREDGYLVPLRPAAVLKELKEAVDETILAAARAVCPLCREAQPHHTVGVSGIGDAERRVVHDLHEIEDTSGVGLRECLAGPIWELLLT